jgi:hypothetical protein
VKEFWLRSDVLAFLVHVACQSGDGFYEVFVNEIDGEAGPSGTVASMALSQVEGTRLKQTRCKSVTMSCLTWSSWTLLAIGWVLWAWWIGLGGGGRLTGCRPICHRPVERLRESWRMMASLRIMKMVWESKRASNSLLQN